MKNKDEATAFSGGNAARKKLTVATAAARGESKARDDKALTAFDILNRSQRSFVVAGVFALMLVGFWQTAIAAAPSQFESDRIVVAYADLNIHSQAGARALYRRLQNASESVCQVESYRELGSLSRVAEAESCYVETLDEAVAQIDSKALKEIHSS